MQFPSAPMQPTPYTPAGGAAPVAQELQGFGRGNDSMLMHVTPGEVQGLQALAMAHGGSLTTNPQTGLPEAGFLESILPMLAGGALSLIPGVGPLMAAGLVGGGTGLLTGDLKQGLMAGLGAFGGAGLAGALGAGAAGAAGSAAHAGAGAATQAATNTAAGMAGQVGAGAANLGAMAPGGAGALGQAAGAAGASVGAGAPGLTTIAPHLAHGAGAGAAGMAQNAAIQGVAQNAALQAAAQPNMLTQMLGPKVGEFATKFGEATAIQGVPRAATTGAAAMGLGAPIMDAMAPKPYAPPEEESNYAGPYRPTDRRVRFRGPSADPNDTSEFSYFEDTNPYPGFDPAPQGYAQGGPVGDFGPSILPGQQAYKPPMDMSRAGVPPTLGGPPSSMGSAPSAIGVTPETGTGGSTATDRMLRRPGGGYRAGTGAEHNWNFRPVAQTGGQMPMRPSSNAADFSSMGMGKGLGALMAAVRSRGAQQPVGATRSFQYDPRTQSVSDMQGFASGGVALKDGAFVMDARTVSEMGNGSSSAGQELLARHGGKPIRGPGDGVSDSIPARLGKQPARVARDEVKFEPEAVRRIGGGNPRKGAERLYELMDKAHKARRTAGRGADTKLRKAL